MTLDERIAYALNTACRFGTEDGDHHKMWVIDQMVRALLDCPRVELTSRFPDAHGNTYTYQGLGESPAYLQFMQIADGEWDEGVAP